MDRRTYGHFSPYIIRSTFGSRPKYAQLVQIEPRVGYKHYVTGPNHFLARCHNRQLNQAPSVLSYHCSLLNKFRFFFLRQLCVKLFSIFFTFSRLCWFGCPYQCKWKKRSGRCKHCVLAVERRSQKFCHATAPLRRRVRAGCSKAYAKFSPHHRPIPGGMGRPKSNQLEMVTTFTYKPSLVRIDACNFKLSW